MADITDDDAAAFAQGVADQAGAEVIRISDDPPTLRDVSSVCNVFWVPRSGQYNADALFGTAAANRVVSGFRKSNGPSWLATDGESDVLSMSWNKDVESPAGVFSLQVKLHEDEDEDDLQLKRIRSGDLLFIYSSNDAQPARKGEESRNTEGTLVTVGIIDRVVPDTVLHSGSEVRVLSINGRDFGVILQESSTVFDQSFAFQENALFNSTLMRKLFTQKVTGSPVELVLGTLDLIYNVKATQSKIAAVQWQLNIEGSDPQPLVKLLDVTTFVQAPMFGYSLPDVLAFAQAGNVWTLLTSYANQAVNEFFVDVRDFTTSELDLMAHLSGAAEPFLNKNDVTRQVEKAAAVRDAGVFASALTDGQILPDKSEPVIALVFRQRPYDHDAFYKLPSHTIFESEIDTDALGVSSHDVFNFFRIRFPDLSAEFQELIYGVHINLESVYRNGIRRMEAQTRYMFGTSDAAAKYDDGKAHPQDFTTIFDWYCGLLATWNACNDLLLSGSVTLRYRPEIRVGTRVEVRRAVRGTNPGKRIYDYYVQAVNHTFSTEAGASRTTLVLTRGIPSGGPGLQNALFWTETGMGIPADLNPYSVFTAGPGFKRGNVTVPSQQGKP